MKFNAELTKKAWQIFKHNCNSNGLIATTRFKKIKDGETVKTYLSEAYKSAIKFFQSLSKGAVKFIKLSGEVTLRMAKPYLNAVNDQYFYFIDMVKESQGLNGTIRLNAYQVL